jgi:pyruvate formate lyase activating enzyme
MIFYKGCPLRCQWCCNPESQSFEVTVMYDHRLCRKFGDCLKSGLMGLTPGQDGIQIERSTLQHAEKLRDICATRALTVSGE